MAEASETVLKANILAALATIQDPDLGKNIVDLGFVKDLKIKSALKGAEVSLSIELTTPACPVKDEFQKSATTLLAALPGISKVDVKMTASVKANLSGDGHPRLPGVKNIVAVGAGKGGVGKSTVALNLALALLQSGARVGILDADIHGPSLAMMLGLKGMPTVKNGRILPMQAFGLQAMTFAFFAPIGDAVIWRGAMLGKAVQQMLFDVDWLDSPSNPERLDLDYLVVDLPPGTGDVPLTLAHSVSIAGAVIVSTPQDLSLIDATKALSMFEKLKVPVLGIVENMSGFVCPHCGEETDIFGLGGVLAEAKKRKIPFLGKIPLHPSVVKQGDSGVPLLVAEKENPSAATLASIAVAKAIAHQLSVLAAQETKDMPHA